jgi:hypothetical protein
VVYVSQKDRRSRKRKQKALDDATMVQPGDIRGAESTPGKCPISYDELLRVLVAYMALLMVLFGSACKHLIEVQAIHNMFLDRPAHFENMTPTEVAELLWFIFLDARMFFSTTTLTASGRGPTSGLSVTRRMMEVGSRQVPRDCPTPKLLSGTRHVQGTSGGRGEGVDNLFPPAGGSGGKEGPHLTELHPEIAKVCLPLLTDFPSMQLNELLKAPSPKVTMDEVKLSNKGACLRMNLLGKCSTQGCSFRHTAITLPAAKATKIAAHLHRAGVAYRIRAK